MLSRATSYNPSNLNFRRLAPYPLSQPASWATKNPTGTISQYPNSQSKLECFEGIHGWAFCLMEQIAVKIYRKLSDVTKMVIQIVPDFAPLTSHNCSGTRHH